MEFNAIDGVLLKCYGAEQEVVVPEGITVIGKNCFSRNMGIKRVVLPKSLKRIEESAFNLCTYLEEVIIPEGVISIERDAFCGCRRLRSISLPETVEEIGKDAFCDSKWGEVFLPKNIRKLGTGAFRSVGRLLVADANPYFCSLDGIVYNKEQTEIISIPEGIAGSIMLAAGIKRIPSSAFKFTNVDSIAIPDSVVEINEYAFFTTKLQSVRLPKAIKEIPSYAFGNCKDLVDVIIPNGVRIIGNNAFSGCSSLEKIVIPQSVKRIGKDAFKGCSSLSKVVFENNSIQLGEGAFAACTSLADKSGFVIINRVLFSYCGKSSDIIIPDGVEKIDIDAFGIRSRITSIHFPESIRSINAIFSYGNIVSNVPHTYLQQTDPLNEAMILRFMQTPSWEKELSEMDCAAIILYQKSKKILLQVNLRAQKNPEGIIRCMISLLADKGSSNGFQRASEFLDVHYEEVPDEVIERLYELAIAAKAKKAEDKISQVINKRKKVIDTLPSKLSLSNEEKLIWRKGFYRTKTLAHLSNIKDAVKKQKRVLDLNGIKITVQLSDEISVLSGFTKKSPVYDMYAVAHNTLSVEEIADRDDPDHTSDGFIHVRPEIIESVKPLSAEEIKNRADFIQDCYRILTDDDMLFGILESAPKREDGLLIKNQYTRLACAGAVSKDYYVYELVGYAQSDSMMEIGGRWLDFQNELPNIESDFVSLNPNYLMGSANGNTKPVNRPAVAKKVEFVYDDWRGMPKVAKAFIIVKDDIEYLSDTPLSSISCLHKISTNQYRIELVAPAFDRWKEKQFKEARISEHFRMSISFLLEAIEKTGASTLSDDIRVLKSQIAASYNTMDIISATNWPKELVKYYGDYSYEQSLAALLKFCDRICSISDQSLQTILDSLPPDKGRKNQFARGTFLILQGDFFIPGRGDSLLQQVYLGGIPSFLVTTSAKTIEFRVEQTMTLYPDLTENKIVDFSDEKIIML